MVSIPPLYRIFFLYIDPLFCLSGIYLAFFSPYHFITQGTPSAFSSSTLPSSTSISSPTLSSQIEFLIHAQGACLLGIFVLQAVLLRQVVDEPRGLGVKIWKIVQVSILMVDLGLMYTSWAFDPKAFVNVKGWEAGDWTGNVILGLVIAMRSSFVLGVGSK